MNKFLMLLWSTAFLVNAVVSIAYRVDGNKQEALAYAALAVLCLITAQIHEIKDKLKI